MNDVDRAGFAFVQRLASDLNTGNVQLPSFPDILIRIKNAMRDENCDADKLARIAAAEPALAARLLSMSNSALMQRGGNAVGDLRTAIGRLGYEMLHTAAMSVALEQVFISSSVKDQRHRLRRVWKDAAQVAALSYALAKNLDCKFNPDEALMAGLLHNVGKLYILMRSSDFQEFFETDEMLESVIEQWHGQIGRAIIEGWEFSDDMADAAANHMDLARSVSGPPDLTDLMTIAWLMSRAGNGAEDEYGSAIRAYSRLGFDAEKREQVAQDSKADIEALTVALGG